MSTTLTMLGTGSALVTLCYNTCFLLRSEQGTLMVDAGGGNGVLSQLEKIEVSPLKIHDIFVTHTHADHILGVIWIIRIYTNAINYGYEGSIHIYGHEKVVSTMKNLCQLMLRPKDQKHLGRHIFFHEVRDRETRTIAGFR